MTAIPTIEEEDAPRPNREHENLVGERTQVATARCEYERYSGNPNGYRGGATLVSNA